MKVVTPLLFTITYCITAFAHAQISPTRTLNLPSELSEASGLAKYNHLFFVHNDSGNPSEIYGIDSLGKIVNTYSLSNASNVDWEALEISEQGDLLIGDIGNNANARTNLRFYLVTNFTQQGSSSLIADTLNFSYVNQHAYPPKDSFKHFDAEAFMLFEDSILIFTKNRSNPYNGFSYVHRLPLKKGEYMTELIDSIYTGQGPLGLDWITDASFSNNTLWLLSHGFVLRFDSFKEMRFNYPKKISLSNFTQKEGCSYSPPFLWVVDEKNPFLDGGILYQYKVDTTFSNSMATLHNDLRKWVVVKDHQFVFNFTTSTKVSCYDLSGKLVDSFEIKAGKQLLPFEEIPVSSFVLQADIKGLLYSAKFTKP